jgi:hypothetical protein
VVVLFFIVVSYASVLASMVAMIALVVTIVALIIVVLLTMQPMNCHAFLRHTRMALLLQADPLWHSSSSCCQHQHCGALCLVLRIRAIIALVLHCSHVASLASKNRLIVVIAMVAMSRSSFVIIALCDQWGE